jgi:glucose-1-phosphate cytidylyltransferase
VIFGNNNKIVEFKEKPVMNEWTNGGFFVFTKEIFDHILSPEDNLETDVFQRLVEKNKIGGYKHIGFWNTINTQKDEENLNKLYENSIKENKELEWHNIRD